MDVTIDMIAAERRELADVLAGLDEDQWTRPSLCEGWTVRHVVAHQTMPFRLSTPRFVLEMVRSLGRYNRMADRVARRDASIPTDALVAALRDNAEDPWTPPGQGPDAALTHDVIHGLDVTDPLGIGRAVPADRLRPVLERSASTMSREFFGTDELEVELQATDLDWSTGAGPPVAGRGQDLVLLLTGRSIPHDRFAGEGAEQLGGPADAGP